MVPLDGCTYRGAKKVEGRHDFVVLGVHSLPLAHDDENVDGAVFGGVEEEVNFNVRYRKIEFGHRFSIRAPPPPSTA